MKLFDARMLRRASVAVAASMLGVLALGAAGASAAPSPNQCTGSNVTGQGAAVMVSAYTNVFDPNFNTSANAWACSGTQGPTKGKPTVSYTKTSSGKGLASWGAETGTGSFVGFAPTNAFVVTEEAPNEAEKAQIEAKETTPGSVTNSLLTIPVAQEAIAIDVHLPAGCTATSTTFPGRLVIGNVTLQGIYAGTVTQWGQIKDGGDALSGETCNTSAPITKIVRPDSAGATNVLKKYLGLINGGKLAVTGGINPEETWVELAQGTQNVLWPTAAGVKAAAKTGDEAEIAEVAAVAGSIGYSSLANARANSAFVPPAGGPNQATFWAPIQNNGTILGSVTKPQTFADPSTDNDTATAAKANCASTVYTNGQGTKFPPASTQDSWAAVTTKTKQKNYPVCTLAYELALTKYSAYSGTTTGEAQTVGDHLGWILQSKTAGTGQLLINENHDYEALPSKVLAIAKLGQALITF